MTRPPPKLDPPASLSKPARDLWRSIVHEYGITDAGGLTLLLVACQAHDEMVAAQQLVTKHGVVVKDKFGQLKANPAAAVVRDSRTAFMRAIRNLNLDLEPLGRPGPRQPRS